MGITVGVPKENYQGERRVAVVPLSVQPLAKCGAEVVIERGAGLAAGFRDADYELKGARLVSRQEAFGAGVLLQVRTAGANPEAGREDLPRLRAGQVIIGFGEPLGAPQAYRDLAEAGVASFAMELMPRITRAQSMDALSSMATIVGYKAVLLAACALPRMFPMLITAAGTIAPAKVLVIGAGVAGLQAIATARRLGAVVSGYDIRPTVKEQIESLGARFVSLELETGSAQDQGGYAQAMGEEFYRRQRELMGDVIAGQDIVITTAAVPGQKAPLLVTREMVERMQPGSVIVDVAAERGGNCELTRPGETIVEREVTILGLLNLASAIPSHASQMYSKNITTFLCHLLKKGELVIDREDEITRETLVTQNGAIVNRRVRQALGLPDLEQQPSAPTR
ncbi:MAG: Re/Si-specific NAD(P)(+) transhydrogenase subunit alpha [Bryobacteraceae bacterium]